MIGSPNNAARPEEPWGRVVDVSLDRGLLCERPVSLMVSGGSPSFSNALLRARFRAGWPLNPSGSRSGEREGNDVRSVAGVLDEAEWLFCERARSVLVLWLRREAVDAWEEDRREERGTESREDNGSAMICRGVDERGVPEGCY